MPKKDLHDKPFDESTLAKLDIFEKYTEQWLPTFIHSRSKTICIIDFFAGPGFDVEGKFGSPILILKVLEKYLPQIISKKKKLKIIFNDQDCKKVESLKRNVAEYLAEKKPLSTVLDLSITNDDFEESFAIAYPLIEKYPCLIFADQSGVKFFSDKYIKALEKTDTTDFIYFISSSYIWRFGNSEEFKKHMTVSLERLKENPYKFIHRSLIEEVKKNLDKNTQLKLFPYSIKKNSNIYGIVFGTKHIRAVEKFLDVVWKENPINGEANFDIEDDEGKRQGHLFYKNLTKIENYEYLLHAFFEEKKTLTNKDIYFMTLENGHPIWHATNYLSRLKKEGKINYKGKPRINYNSIFYKCVIVNFNWIENEKDKNRMD